MTREEEDERWAVTCEEEGGKCFSNHYVMLLFILRFSRF